MNLTPKKPERLPVKIHEPGNELQYESRPESLIEEELEKMEMQMDEEYMDRLEEMKMYREIEREMDYDFWDR